MNLLSQIPIIGGEFDDSDQQALDQYRKNQELYAGLSLPDLQNYKPEDYQYAGDYNPAQAQGRQIQEDPGVRSAQLSALSKMAGLADNGLSSVDQAGFQNARDMGGQMMASGNSAALQNAQARGIGGSGLEYAMRGMASQGGAQAAQQAGLQQAADSARQRALYTQAYGSALSGMRGQDFNANSANADILNRFNMYNTGNQNQAQQWNLANRQNLMNQNTGQHNYAQQYNNGLAQQRYQDAYQKVSGQAGANNQMAQGYWGENAANSAGRNANTSLAATVGMGLAGYGPMAKKTQSQSQDDEE